MSLGFRAMFADALKSWQHDREVLLPLAGLTMFLPSYALMLLVPEMPRAGAAPADSEAARAWMAAFSEWAGTFGWWFIIAQLLVMLGMLTVVAFNLDRQRPTLGGAALRATGLLMRYVLATLLFAFPLGMLTLVVLAVPLLMPFAFAAGCYVFGRMLLVGPAIVAEAPLGAAAAVARSWKLTRGHGWMLATSYALILLVGALGSGVFQGLAAITAGTGSANPVIVSIFDGFAAALAALSSLVLALVQVAAYRRVVSRGT